MMKAHLTYLKMPDLFKELEQLPESEFFAVIDEAVRPHLPHWVAASPRIFWLQGPEAQKNLTTFSEGCRFFLQHGISRTSTLYAIGGGATTDLAGYVAASLLRGIKWVSIPTTLLAMVDGAIGGKVAVNVPEGKNLIGAFHAPEQVFICEDFLVTLPEQEWLSGKGEIVKYSFLSKKIHDLVLNKANLSVIAWECALFKKEVVENDFKETGDRILLNLGHTLGHAFESTLKIPHGLAVMMGLKYLLKLLQKDSMLNEWKKVIEALDIDQKQLTINKSSFSLEIFLSYLQQDKKRQAQNIRLIIPEQIGSNRVQEMTMDEFLQKIKQHDDFKA
jgi:3-dehydroquinate synthase